MEQHLVQSDFVVSTSEGMSYDFAQPTTEHPFAKIKITDSRDDSPLMVKLTVTATYVDKDSGKTLKAQTYLFACASQTLKSDTQALVIYGADNLVYFVDMSVVPWKIAPIGDRSDLDPSAEIMVEDGTVATWLTPDEPSFIWCYVLNMAALSKTRPSKK